MSHVSKVSVEIKDLAALKRAVLKLGGIWKEGQQTFAWYGRWVNDYSAQDAAYHHGVKPEDYGKCDHAIAMPEGGYEVGVVKNPAGNGFVLVYDQWRAKHIEQRLGKLCGKLASQYGAEVAKAKMASKGYSASEKWIEGKLQVTFAKVGA